MRKTILFIMINLMFMTVLASQKVDISDQLKSNIQSRIDGNDVVGIVIGTTSGGQVDYYCQGFRSIDAKETVDQNSIFEIGSISKTFTGLMLAEMVMRGKVKLDDDIQNYLPEGVKAPKHSTNSIKLVHLSNHTSGLPRLPFNLNPANQLDPYADYSAEMMYQFLNGLELTVAAGKSYEYSNLAAGLLGHILATKSETTYEKLLHSAISDPLGMKNTGITQVDGALAKGHMAGKEVPNWNFGSLEGAGAIRSSASDMMRYLQANMGLTKSELYPAMQLAHKNSGAADSNPIVGLGWHTMTYEGKDIVWHNGGTGGYTSFMGWIKGTDQGVVVLNNSTENVDDIGIHALISSYPLKVIKKSVEVEDAILSSYVGKYELAPTFILTVTKEGNQLNVQATGQASLPIYPESETKFYYKVVDAQLVFKKDENGKVESVTLFQAGQEMPAKRME